MTAVTAASGFTPTPDRSLWTHLRRDQQPPRLIVIGEIDLATIDEFDRAVREATRHHRRVIIDLTGVEFLDNVGLRTLYRYREDLIAVLITPRSLVARALHITGFPGVVTVPTNHEQAPWVSYSDLFSRH